MKFEGFLDFSNFYVLNFITLHNTNFEAAGGLWLITRVGSFMFFQAICMCEFLTTLGANEWFITSVDSFMSP